MRSFRKTTLWACAAVLAACGLTATAAETGLELFEKSIRPLLVDQCYSCHSAQSGKSKGSLVLDTREGLLKGGDSGPAIVPGDPDKSLLIKAVRYTDENLQMPPKGKRLPADKVELLEAWVKAGAPDPRTTTNSTAAVPAVEKARQEHWAFRPVQMPSVPQPKAKHSVQTPVDAFVLARLESKNLVPSPRADKRALIRRATYDLTGLPPTPEEVDAFLADKAPDAFARLVDRLLASPRYGERWGRYWLDVARYADTKGYVFEEERRYPFAYTYRDYVIRAFNEDLPYDQFVIQQLAADRLELGEDKRPLAGLGFLTLGRRFLNNQPDIIDDRLDVMGRGLMGLTVSCARCHDHKYDPISAKDYYSLYGVFASSEEPAEKPLLGSNSLPKEYPEYKKEREKREKELRDFLDGKQSELMGKMRGQVGDYLLVSHDSQHEKHKSNPEKLVRERKLAPNVARRWTDYLAKLTPAHPVFGPWIQLAAVPETNFSTAAKGLSATFIAQTNGTNKLNPMVAALFTNAPASLKNVADRYNNLFAGVDKQWQTVTKQTNAPAALSDASAESLRQVLYASESPLQVDPDSLRRLFDTPAQQRERALKRKIDELDATHAGAPPRAMAMLDRATPVEPVVFIRGNAGNRGPKVPRQFLEILAGPDRKPFTNGSGRLELAQAIASTNNPLTARVLVNRVWLHHFGTALVRTPSDFGLRAEPPTHPELLDYLAARFMADGWSVKKLHRLMMLSSTYQQASEEIPANASIDPANDLLWRMNRRRLDLEALRDTLLATAGRLDLTEGGHPVDITKEPFPTRRTVYAFIERQNLPGVFRTFDFASPDTSTAQRFATTVPQQALYLMNSPFVIEQAKHVLQRPEIKKAADDRQRIESLYRVAFHRSPDADELALGQAYIKETVKQPATNTAPAPVWQYGFGEYDASAGKVKGFKRLPHYTSGAWQGGARLPDDKLGWVMLNATGGHVGNDLKHAAVRRWTAPADGTVKIRAVLSHDTDKGDGVRSRVLSSRTGMLGEWIAHNSKATTNVDRVQVKRGDTLDFITDLRGDIGFDSFTWAPVLTYQDTTDASTRKQWKAKEDFAGPEPKFEPLTPWQKYAQALLLANELAFID